MSLPDSAWPAAMTSPATAASRIQRCDESPAAVELGGGADPVGVHGHRQCGGRGVAGQATLAGGHLGQVQSPAAEVHRHGRGEVSDAAQLGEVVVEVGVGAIQLGGPAAEPLQHVGRQLGEPLPGVDGGVFVMATTLIVGPLIALSSAHSVVRVGGSVVRAADSTMPA